MIERLLEAERARVAGELDLAERLLGQVVEADPRNAIAVVGLARVALDRGDVAAADRNARRALELDPDEAAARRILDELVREAPEPTPEPTPESAPESAPAPEPEAAGAPEPRAPVGALDAEPRPATTAPRRHWFRRLLEQLFRR